MRGVPAAWTSVVLIIQTSMAFWNYAVALSWSLADTLASVFASFIIVVALLNVSTYHILVVFNIV